MNQVKKILDVEIAVASFPELNQLIERLSTISESSPLIGVRILFELKPFFPLDEVFLSDAVNVLAKEFSVSLASIVRHIDRTVMRQFGAKEIAQIHQNYSKIRHPREEKQTKEREEYAGSDAFCEAFSQRLARMREDAHAQYQQLLAEFKHCFTPLLEPNVEVVEYFEGGEVEVPQGEAVQAATSHIAPQKTVKLFYDSLIEYQHAYTPEVHPSMAQIFAPPLKQLAEMSATGLSPWSREEVQIGFTNEGFDAPDLIVDWPSWKELLSSNEATLSTQEPLYIEKTLETTRLRVRTRKPVPEHHALLDVSGCYVSQEIAFYGLWRQLELLLREHPLTMLDVYYLTSFLLYFPPFKCVIDERFYGTPSRFTRFCSSEQNATAYVKAQGIGGGVRFQLHATVDLAAGEEVRLLYQQYSIIRQGSVLAKIVSALEEIHASAEICIDSDAWDREDFVEIPKDEENLLRALFVARAGERMCSRWEELWLPVTLDNLAEVLQENLIFTFPALNYVEFGVLKAQGQLVHEHNAMAFFHSETTTIASGNDYVPLVFENMREAHIFKSEASILEFAKKFGDSPNVEADFLRLLIFFALERSFAFYDYQVATEPQNALIQRMRAFLLAECERVSCVSICVAIAPHHYPNYAPYVSFSPLLRTCFDLEAEKLLLVTFETVFRYLMMCAPQDDKYPEEEIKKLVYRLVEENSSFNRLIYGIHVSVAEYQAEFARLLKATTYKDVDEAVAQFIEVDVLPLVDYATFFQENRVETISDHLECIVAAFKGKINPPLEEPLRIVISNDLEQVVSRETYEFFKLLAPVAIKPRVEEKKLQADANCWPACEHVGRVCINAKYGAQQLMPEFTEFGNVSEKNDDENQVLFESECFQHLFSSMEKLENICAEREVSRAAESTRELYRGVLNSPEAVDSRSALEDLMGVMQDLENSPLPKE